MDSNKKCKQDDINVIQNRFEVIIRCDSEFTAYRIRREFNGFPVIESYYLNGTSKERFEAFSELPFHIQVEINNALIAAVRG